MKNNFQSSNNLRDKKLQILFVFWIGPKQKLAVRQL